jgi:hypothetical protein
MSLEFALIVSGVFICGLVTGYVVRDIISRARRRRIRKRRYEPLWEPPSPLRPPSSTATVLSKGASSGPKRKRARTGKSRSSTESPAPKAEARAPTGTVRDLEGVEETVVFPWQQPRVRQ